MDNKTRVPKLKDDEYQQIDVTKRTFEEMANVLQEAYGNKHKRRGRHSSLPVELQLLMALEYLRQYITFAELGFNYGVCESTAQNYVVWVEDVLVKSGKFSLPGKKALLNNEDIEVVLIDRKNQEAGN